MYNVADVVVNIASNEGWGLSSTEAMLSGTPIINNVTGGLQDQCGFLDDQGNWLQFDGEFSTNHKGTYKNHGQWVEPVFPSNRSIQGSPTTPYIFDDRVNFEDVANAMMKWWETPANIREECGAAGRSFCLDNGLTAQQMGDKMIEMINHLLKMPKQPRLRYTLNKVTKKQYKNLGIVCEQ
jgi:glycosyltransferase involved in cell wall biosynthesis